MNAIKAVFRTIGRGVERLNFLSGVFTGLILVLMVFIVVYEVTVRYIFRSPDVWSMDIIRFMMVGIVFLAASYVALVKGHIRVDLLIIHFPQRVQAWINLITAVLSLFVGTIFLWGYVDQAIKAYVGKWGSTNLLHTPQWPAMWAMAVGFGLMCLQIIIIIVRQTLHLMGKGPDQWTEAEHAAEIPEMPLGEKAYE
jgi:TRAP-type C4-dicarboxylate transport system permease small subunit